MSKPTTNSRGKIQKPGQSQPKTEMTLADQVEAMKPQLARVLPKYLDADKMARLAINAIRLNPKLARCTAVSFLGSLMQAAQLGLEPNTTQGHCYLIPYWNKHANGGNGAYECQFQMGYKGMVELALRSGKVTDIWTDVVHEGDVYKMTRGTDPKLIHEPVDECEENEIIAAYACADLINSDRVKFERLSRKKIDERRSRSRAANDGPWITDYEAMAKKTAIRALYPTLPKTPEMALAAAIDEAPEYGKDQRELWSREVNQGLKELGVGDEPQQDEGDDVADAEYQEAG